MRVFIRLLAWVGSCCVVAVGLAVGCAPADPSGGFEPGVATEIEALDDSCGPCNAGLRCCNGSCVAPAVGDYSPGLSLVKLGTNGCAEYRRYANRATSTPSSDPGSVHVVPDFSHSGYLGGGKPIPWVRVKKIVSTTDGPNDRVTLQAAIDFVGNSCPKANGVLDCPADSQGIHGAVLIRRGVYDLDGELIINKSGVVLRGDGQGSGGTILRSLKKPTGQNEGTKLIRVGTGLDPLGVVAASTITAPSSGSTFAVPVGAKQVTVLTNNGTFQTGQRVLVRRTPNTTWITELGMDHLPDIPPGEDDPPGTPPSPPAWRQPDQLIRDHERVVVRAGLESGGRQTLDLDFPLVDAIESRYGGGQVVKVTLDTSIAVQNVGIERLRLDSLDFVDPIDEEHTASAIRFEEVRNSWIRQVTILHFGFGSITLGPGSFNTVEDVAVLDGISDRTRGSRRYSFYVSHGTGNLIQRCYSRNARHNFISSKNANGPNVWLDCVATKVGEEGDDGPHAQWATGLLFDNVETGRLNVQNGWTSGTGHGWRGGQVMFWNSEVTASGCTVVNANCPAFINQTPAAAMSWGVGNIGPKINGKYFDEIEDAGAPLPADGIWLSADMHVSVRSLYLQQLHDRLSTSAYNAVTSLQQRAGRIGDRLRTWEGEADAFPNPTCSSPGGILHSSGACCPSSCGVCGGSDCSQNPGGYDACCTGSILASGRSCLEYGPPCIKPTSDPKCSSGIRGTIDSTTVCCDGGCGVCGGNDCSQQPGGVDKCCKEHIKNDNESCLTHMPGCVMSDPQCTTGIPSTTSEKACCSAKCGRCGGNACGSLPGGSTECCRGDIAAAGRSCATNPPPCVMP